MTNFGSINFNGKTGNRIKKKDRVDRKPSKKTKQAFEKLRLRNQFK